MSLPAPTVLVTGSSGHLGHALMLSLPSHGYTPLGIDLLPPSLPSAIQGTVTDRPLIANILTSHPTIKHIIHTATLHKPHVGTHSKQAFIETNITGTLVLLEEAARHDIASFVFLSTTSAFGAALSPSLPLPLPLPAEQQQQQQQQSPPRQAAPAAWIDEAVVPVPKNIYGVTKVAAEDVCRLVHVQTGLPVVVLRTSRFFPEEDDDADRRAAMGDENLKVCELAYRRVDMADVVGACVCAVRKAAQGEMGWGRFVVSAPTVFEKDDKVLRRLNGGDPGDTVGMVMERCVPGCQGVFKAKGWNFLNKVDRVYDSSRAVRELGWRPVHTFERAVAMLARGEEWRSELTITVGKRGYHDASTGVYTVR